MAALGALLLAALAPARGAAQMDDMPGMGGAHGPAAPDAMAGVLGIPMERMGSGTAWIPDAVPLPSASRMVGGWHVMAHGVAWLQYDHQHGPRGDDQLGSTNWGMVMASHALAGGAIQPRVMLSLEPATLGASGYPLLLQTGETYRGAPNHDRQHPHDFAMEAAALFERPLGSGVALLLYGGPAGEPALGPPAFMHRPSGFENPLAPLSHHQQDATHIVYGVATAGVFGRRWRLEGSAFNGREPDESRWGLESPRFDSRSARLTVNPGASLSLTAGYGRLVSPEALHPDEDVDRAVVSASWSRALADGSWSASAVWGRNLPDGGAHATDGVLLEASVADGPGTLFARAEYVEKTAGDLVFPPSAGIAAEQVFGVGAFSLGYVRDVAGALGLTGGVGAVGSVDVIDPSLVRFYGSRNPWGGAVFVRMRPKGRTTSGMSMPGMRMSAGGRVSTRNERSGS